MKKKICYVIKFVCVACIVNILIGCVDGQGNDISWAQWMFAPASDGSAGPAGSFLNTVGQLLGGPWGYALTGLGASTGPLYKWWKHSRSASGLIQATQEARGALDPETRKVFDDTAREAMNNAKSGNLRAYVRDTKNKLRRSGKMVLEKFSDKHKK